MTMTDIEQTQYPSKSEELMNIQGLVVIRCKLFQLQAVWKLHLSYAEKVMSDGRNILLKRI